MYLIRDHAADFAGRTPKTIDQWAREGLPHVRQPRCRQRLFSTDELDRFAALMAERSRVGKGRPRGSRNQTNRKATCG